MKVLLLLAGQSKRFWPLQEKPLFPICGKPLIQHQMERLKEAGLTDVILIGSDNNLATIQEHYPDCTTIQQEDVTLGMRGAVMSALPQCGNEPVLIVSGNDVFDPSAYKSLLYTAAEDGIDGAILAQTVTKYFPGGYLNIEDGKIISIIEKPGEGNEPSDMVNIVAHVHNDASALLEALQDIDESTDDGYEQGLQKLFNTKTYHAVPYHDLWQAVKFPWHMLHLLPVLLEKIEGQTIHPTAQIHETAVVTGNVIIEEGARIMPHASVVGPCYIGKNVIVANNALARGSSIGDGCVVGFSTEVKGSVLAGDVWTHMNYVGDSVVGHNVSFGAGTMTGNLRLDEENVTSAIGEELYDSGLVKFGSIIGNDCRIGIHVSLSPGCKVGAGTFISSKVFVQEDIASNQFARLKDGQLKISENRTEAPGAEEREKFRRKL